MRNDAVSVVSQLAASRNSVFTRHQAAALGLTKRQISNMLAARLLHEPWRGALVACRPGCAPTWDQLLRAALLERPAWAADCSAARLQGFEGFEDSEELQLICSPSAHIRLGGVTVRRTQHLHPADLVTVDGIDCTNAARTLCDLANLVSADSTERAFDDLMRRGTHPQWLRQTAVRVLSCRRRGAQRVLDLLDDFERRGVVRGSWFEGLVERCLDHPELASLERQYTLVDDTGAHVARFDLAIPDARLGIEGHSRSHHFGAINEASDERRDNAAGAMGWDVMYLGYADVMSPSSALDSVLARVRARRSGLG